MTDVLCQRGLNRATLARQYLLDRAPARAIDAIEHLGGMQSQAPLAPYVGLWTRLQDFAPDELSALIEERQVVRLHLMRNTLHLVSARDCLDWRALFYPLHAAEFSAHFRRGTEEVDRDAPLAIPTAIFEASWPWGRRREQQRRGGPCAARLGRQADRHRQPTLVQDSPGVAGTAEGGDRFGDTLAAGTLTSEGGAAASSRTRRGG